MSGFSAMEIINRSAGDVFEYLIDLGKTSTWNRSFLCFEFISHGPMRVGSRWHEVRFIGDRHVNSIVEVVAHQGTVGREPFIHACSWVQMGIQSTYHFRVETEEVGRARVEMTVLMKGTNFIANLFVPFFANTMKKMDATLLLNLKQVVEDLPLPLQEPGQNADQDEDEVA